jgi:hypothetical protein
MRQPVCDEREPDLLATESATHLAACHFSDELTGVSPADLFDAGDTTADLTASDVVEGADHGK